jgi:transcriptional pleiotropic regulator of transition state genes
MKATGIIRRIDDLGRVVIPKEIRRTLRISEGDPLEICISNDMVCYRKYNPTPTYKEGIKDLINIMSEDVDFVNPEVIKLLKQAKDMLKDKEETEDSL